MREIQRKVKREMAVDSDRRRISEARWSEVHDHQGPTMVSAGEARRFDSSRVGWVNE